GRERTGFALALAMRSHARVTGYYLCRRQTPSLRDCLDEPRTALIENASADFDRELKLRGLDGTWVLGNDSHVAQDIAHHARCVDLVIAGLGFPDDPAADNLDIERLVIECSTPVLGIPIAAVPEQIGSNV